MIAPVVFAFFMAILFSVVLTLAFTGDYMEKKAAQHLKETLEAVEFFVETFGRYPSNHPLKMSIVQTAVTETMRQYAEHAAEYEALAISRFENARNNARRFHFEARDRPDEYLKGY